MNETKRRAIAQAEAAARETASTLGLEVVEFVFHDQGRHSHLRIDLDRAGPEGVGLRDCEAFSRALDARIDTLPGLEQAYELQVSSPGIDRPIRSDDDIRRNTGRAVRAELRDDAGRFEELHGVLAGLDADGAVRIVSAGDERRLSRAHIVLMKQEVSSSGSRRRDR
ncbi:MAG TPA: hypothetical protein VFV19_12140 [Candidatus Polarisedimenticolaceae bacterium]|nr:hypothetical protein [Candidatus Polarisedimenticolaceae bacterium]